MLDEKAHLSPKVWKPSFTHDFFFGRERREFLRGWAEVGL